MKIFLIKRDSKVKIVSASVEAIIDFLKYSCQECIIEVWEKGVKQSLYTSEEFRIEAVCSSQFSPPSRINR